MLKVAILAEKYAADYTWYVDTILNLIRIAGDYVSEEVSRWSVLFVHIVINNDESRVIPFEVGQITKTFSADHLQIARTFNRVFVRNFS